MKPAPMKGRAAKAAPATPVAPSAPSPADNFDVMDQVMQRWGEVKGTAAVMLCVLDGSPDEVAVETMRRHLTADLDRMSAALCAAWGALVAVEVRNERI